MGVPQKRLRERERLMLYSNLSACNKYFSLSLIYFPLSSIFLPLFPLFPFLSFSISSLAWMFVFTVLGQAFICSFRSNSYCDSHSINRVIHFSPFSYSPIQIHFFSYCLWVFVLCAVYCARSFLWGCINSRGFNYGVPFPNLS